MRKLQIISIIILFPLFLLILCTILPGVASITYNGFALDAESNLYLGKKGRVEVIDAEGTVIRTFHAKSFMHFDFTILDDEIVMRVGTNLFWMDLQGNVIKEELKSERWKEILPPGGETVFVDENGTKYTMEYSGFLRTSIFKWDGDRKEEIFKMPLFDYLMRLVLIITVIDIVIVACSSLGRLNSQRSFGGRLYSLWDPHRL